MTTKTRTRDTIITAIDGLETFCLQIASLLQNHKTLERCAQFILVASAVIFTSILFAGSDALLHASAYNTKILIKIPKVLLPLSIASIFVLQPKRGFTAYFSLFTIFVLFAGIQLLCLLKQFPTDGANNLQALLSNGALKEFPGSNLNYGLHMAANFLNGHGLTINGSPPWHRMPGYGLFVALAGNANSPLTMALNAVLMQLFCMAAALTFFYHCALKIMPKALPLALVTIITLLPYSFYYHQIESVMPSIVLVLLALSCIYIKHYNFKTLTLRHHIMLHSGFALWLLFRPDIIPGWIIVSLLLYCRRLNTLKYLAIPVLMMASIGISWGLYKYTYTQEFSMTTNSFGASLMVGLWEVPHKFIWEISDESFYIWAKEFSTNPSTSKATSSLALHEVFNFWLTYPVYFVSMVLHKTIAYITLSGINKFPYNHALFLVMILSLSVVLKYKRTQTLLLGWMIPFNVSIFFLTYTSSGRFYSAPNLALLVTASVLLIDTGFLKQLVKMPYRSFTVLLLFSLFYHYAENIDYALIQNDKLRYYAPFLNPEDSTFNIIKPIDKTELAEIVNPQSIPVANIKSAYHKAHVHPVKNGTVTIKTAPVGWTYAAFLELPPALRKQKNVTLILDTNLKNGVIVAGIFSKDKSHFIAQSPEYVNLSFSKEKTIKIAINIANPADAGYLVISNGGRNKTSTLEIKEAYYGTTR